MADRHPRIIMSSEGMEGTGKSDFALSAPRPMTYLDFDYGVEGITRWPAPEVHKQYDLLAAEWLAAGPAAKHALDVMQRFVADFRQALKDRMRTLVVDTFTASWAGQRLARAEDKYVEMEEEFVSLIRAAYASPHTNVILIHHLRQDWKRNQAGKSYKGDTWSRDGMDGIANKVQLAIRQRYVQPIPEQRAAGFVTAAGVPGRFEVDILKSRDNIGLVGQTYPGMDFTTLCSLVCPTVDWSK